MTLLSVPIQLKDGHGAGSIDFGLNFDCREEKASNGEIDTPSLVTICSD